MLQLGPACDVLPEGAGPSLWSFRELAPERVPFLPFPYVGALPKVSGPSPIGLRREGPAPSSQDHPAGLLPGGSCSHSHMRGRRRAGLVRLLGCCLAPLAVPVAAAHASRARVASTLRRSC